jgi:hypothetical protein
MAESFEKVYRDVRSWAETHEIRVYARRLKPGRAGTFDGLTVTMNSVYPGEERVYYLAHALGSIVRWSLSESETAKLFNELRNSKSADDRARLERAVERYRAFEVESSEFAVWLLAKLEHADVIPSYTNFMRADLEALTEFHRSGRAPVWREFFSCWNQAVAAGHQLVLPFEPKAIPALTPQRIENQEILQEQG